MLSAVGICAVACTIGTRVLSAVGICSVACAIGTRIEVVRMGSGANHSCANCSGANGTDN